MTRDEGAEKGREGERNRERERGKEIEREESEREGERGREREREGERGERGIETERNIHTELGIPDIVYRRKGQLSSFQAGYHPRICEPILEFFPPTANNNHDRVNLVGTNTGNVCAVLYPSYLYIIMGRWFYLSYLPTWLLRLWKFMWQIFRLTCYILFGGIHIVYC